MATRIFRSELAGHIQSFLELRKASGREENWDAKMMQLFDRFLMGELNPGQAITKDTLERYMQSISHLSTGTRLNRLSILRNFCIYLKYFDCRTYLIPGNLLPRRSRHLPYIYSPEEITAIMSVAKNIGPAGSIRPSVICTLIGLLASTGLRIGEALRLTLSDVDIRRGVLLVRKTKFRKTRNVPLSKSAIHQMSVYMRKRRKYGFSTAGDSPLFVNSRGCKYGPTAICTIVLRIMRELGIRRPKEQRGPRIHDFRHTFAVSRLLSWYRQGDNLMAKLPLLSTYLGHSTVTSTEMYLHSTSELLEKVSERFHGEFAIPNLAKEDGDENRN